MEEIPARQEGKTSKALGEITPSVEELVHLLRLGENQPGFAPVYDSDVDKVKDMTDDQRRRMFKKVCEDAGVDPHETHNQLSRVMFKQRMRRR